MPGSSLRGAAQPARATKAVSLIARAATLMGVVIIGLLALFAPKIMSIFSSDRETIAAGAHVMRSLGIGYLAFTVGTVFDLAQAGAGDTVSPMIINIISLWLVQVPLAYLLSQQVGLGSDGIWMAMNLGWTVQAALLFRGPREPVFPQRIHVLSSPDAGNMHIFLVPIGPDDKGMRYEAVFN